MKRKIYLTTGLFVATLLFCAALTAQTTPRKSSSPSAPVSSGTTASPAASATKQAARPIPFHGMVAAVDKKAKTFTIASKEKPRVFKIADKTAITKSGKPATMTDIAENEEVSGSYWKNADGTLEAKTVKLGPVEKAKTSTASPAAAASASASPKP
jgi:hypothetical protein